MAYDEELDIRIREKSARWDAMSSRKMFGGVCHMSNGNMVCGVYKDFLILRLGEIEAAAALDGSDTRPFNVTGRPMKGWVMVDRDGYEDDQALEEWLEKAKRFVDTLPAK
ncbi:MAG: TfoX/Sxy family protein [Bacteroidales bacterium]|nr:TfoX/Sxy family protein [Candidatus Latescibacterota bacterium]